MRQIKVDVSKCPNDCDCCEIVSDQFVNTYGKFQKFPDPDMQPPATRLLIDRLITCCPDNLIKVQVI